MSDLLARMERVPFSRPHQRLLAMGGLGLAFDGLDVAILAFVLPAIKDQWHLTGFQAGLIGSSTLIGYLFGAVSAGMLGDRFGRRKVMMWALGIYGLATLLAAFSPTWQFFFIARLIAGIGTGAESSIIPAFLSEFAPGRSAVDSSEPRRILFLRIRRGSAAGTVHHPDQRGWLAHRAPALRRSAGDAAVVEAFGPRVPAVPTVGRQGRRSTSGRRGHRTPGGQASGP